MDEQLSSGLDDLALLGPPEILTFYDGSVTLHYHDDRHEYYRLLDDGSKILVTSVTAAGGKIDKGGAITQWAANQTTEYLRQHLLDGCAPDKQIAVLASDLARLLDEARFNYRGVKKTAADIGTIAHDWLERYIKAIIAGERKEFPLPEHPNAAKCVKAAVDWMAKHKFRPLTSELKVYSREYNYSGTEDWEAYMSNCGDPACCPSWVGQDVLTLGDFKSSKYVYDEHRLQTAAYKHAREEEFPDLRIDMRLILRLGKEDGEFESAPFHNDSYEDDFNAYLAALTIANWDRQLKEDRAYDRAVVREEKKRLKALTTRKKPKPVTIKELPDAA